MTRAELIEALKSAQGLDRELDARIALELKQPTTYELVEFGEAYVARARKHYTQSLDAAISLVEGVRPGWEWLVGTDQSDGTAYAAIQHGEFDKEFAAPAATPAIALLIALLSSMED